jgi:hypothetical protein
LLWTKFFWLLIFPVGNLAQDFSSEQTQYFERYVRPILAEKCFGCHGPDKQESGLRLDSRDYLMRGGDRGPSAVPGDAHASLLIQAVTQQDPDLKMPPDDALNDSRIMQLRRWIDQGLAWTPATSRPADSKSDAHANHWAFQPLSKPPLPGVSNSAWPLNAIDRFVLSKLEAAGLEPSPPADQRTLVRRAYLDLTGLPPSYAEVEQYSEAPPEFFQGLVDQLLCRRAYGERWARHWLDVARYADTKGYVDGGQVRFAFAYTYRDYVIRALNEDLPYDQFLLDQLAADQLDYADGQRWRLAGLGFLTVGRRFNENLHDILDDQIDAISRGLQGMSVACARCHDHKYDPIPTTDYYSFHGILASSHEPPHTRLPVLDPEPDTDEYREYVAELDKRGQTYQSKFQELHARIQHELRAFAGDYLVYLVQESPRHRRQLQNPLKTDRTILRGPSAYGYGAIQRWRGYVRGRGTDDAVFGLWNRMDRVDKSAFRSELVLETANGTWNQALRRTIQSSPPASMVELARVYGKLLEQTYVDWQQYVQVKSAATRFEDPVAEQLRQVLYGPDAPPVMSALESIDCYHLDEHTHMRNLLGKIEELSVKTAALPGRAMILRKRSEPYEPVVFLRGQPNRPGQRVPRSVPRLFQPAAAGSDSTATAADRLDLARAIVSPDNRFTARVIVNRVWHWHLGRPLVETASDFGVRGTPPTHPELLDFLAVWLIDHDWSLKDLHRLIMASRTYQQSSQHRRECATVDPENRWLWRFNPRRVEWEVLRDSLLAASGRLEVRQGGQSVELAPDDPEATCRTIYLHIDRQDISRFARNFDFPSPDFTCPIRPITTVPQQQLFFLNSPFVLSQARTLARWVTSLDVDSDTERMRLLGQRLFQRGLDSVDGVPTRSGESLNVASDGSDLAGEFEFWTTVAHAMLQSNEFIFLQ